jgi:Trypsin-like peptidase domain
VPPPIASWKGVAELLKFLAAALLIPPIALGQVALTTAQIAKRVSPSVVVIQGKTDSGEVLGSGFIVSKDGKIVTNFHVIRDMRTASVQLANNEIFDSVSVLATDERRDVAIVKIAGFNLPVLELGNSDALTVGEPAVIVGSPRGLEGTVTAGILSSIRDSGEGFKVLQTDAAVNPGNSGGPLVNNKGQAIGVVSFKLRSAEGLNFAVPINYVRGLLNKVHEPMSLEQMRQSLVAEASVDQQNSGPSLKETLDWLKEKIPLAANHYTFDLTKGWPVKELGRTKDVSLKTVPIRFESCTVSFESIETWKWENYPQFLEVHTWSQTIPLGALTGGDVTKDSFSVKANPFIDKEEKIEIWTVFLNATAKVILHESHEVTLHESREVGENTTESESKNYAGLTFYDESIAKRVLEAFLHAADLCRGKEAF